MANMNSVTYAPRTNALGNATTETEFLKNSDGTTIALLRLPGGGKVDKRRIRIVAAGRVKGNTTTNFTAIIYGAAAASATKSSTGLASTGAVAVNSTSGRWELIFEGHVDSTDKTLEGRMHGFVATTAVALAANSAALTSLDPTIDAPATFCVSGLFSASNASNTATLEEFSLELL